MDSPKLAQAKSTLANERALHEGGSSMAKPKLRRTVRNDDVSGTMPTAMSIKVTVSTDISDFGKSETTTITPLAPVPPATEGVSASESDQKQRESVVTLGSSVLLPGQSVFVSA